MCADERCPPGPTRRRLSAIAGKAGTKQLETTGFRTTGRRGTFWRRPTWNVPLEFDSVRSLASLDTIQNPEPDRVELKARGIVEVYRSQRLTVGQFRDFTRGSPT